MDAIEIKHFIEAALLAAGRPADTPAVAISWATTDKQQVVRSTLDTLPDDIQAHNLPTPMVVLLGQVTTLHETLAWFQPDGQSAGFVPHKE